MCLGPADLSSSLFLSLSVCMARFSGLGLLCPGSKRGRNLFKPDYWCLEVFKTLSSLSLKFMMGDLFWFLMSNGWLLECYKGGAVFMLTPSCLYLSFYSISSLYLARGSTYDPSRLTPSISWRRASSLFLLDSRVSWNFLLCWDPTSIGEMGDFAVPSRY